MKILSLAVFIKEHTRLVFRECFVLGSSVQKGHVTRTSSVLAYIYHTHNIRQVALFSCLMPCSISANNIGVFFPLEIGVWDVAGNSCQSLSL